MALYCLPCLKTLPSQLRVVTKCCVPTVPRHHHLKQYLEHRRKMSQIPLANNKESSSKNIIYSRQKDCLLHNRTAVQRFFEQASLWPNLVAVECGLTGRKYTYENLRESIRRFGSALVRQGFKRGEVLGMVLPSLPEIPIVLLGAAGIGMPVTIVNPVYTYDEIARQLQNSDATVAVTIPQLAGTMLQVAELCPKIRRLIVVGGPQEGFASLVEMFHDPGDLFNENIEIDPSNDIFVIPYSRGTTGLPKGVMLTHSNVCANQQQMLHKGTTKTSFSRLGSGADFFQEVYICALPFCNIYEMVSLLLTGLEHGAKLVTLPRYESESYISCINKHQATILPIVPQLMTLLGYHPGVKLDAFRRLHTVIVGGAPLAPAVANKFAERLRKNDLLIQEGYGMTETSFVTHLGSLVDHQIGSFGEPVSRTKVKVVDINTGETLGPGERGEMCVSGPQVMKGYYKNPEATREIIDSDGWLHTGDMVFYNDHKQFFMVDHLQDLIKVKGFQVPPSELEDVIRRHPAVLDVAVIGIPDDVAGEFPRAYVVKKGGMTVSKEDIIKFVDTKVVPHKKLKGGVVFLDAIPKTNTGKLVRREFKIMLSQLS